MLNILYQDKFIVVCEKPVGILSEEVSKKRNMPSLLKEQVKAYKISVVHRLDKLVGGVMVFSKNAKATANLSRMILEHKLTKEYLAVVKGKPENESGVFEDILFKDSSKNKSFVVKTLRKGAKQAKLEYKVIKTIKRGLEELSLVKIKLHTGRTHQIRVQFSSRKMPLLGDEKYGGADKNCKIALWSTHLEFDHPILKQKINIYSFPENKYPWNLFGKIDESVFKGE